MNGMETTKIAIFRGRQEGSEVVTFCHGLNLETPTAGKTDYRAEIQTAVKGT
jgi:hypothetical protein